MRTNIFFFLSFITFNCLAQLISGPELNTASYDAFGIQIKTSENTSIYFYRQGTKHVGLNSGKIMAVEYNYTNNSFNSPWEVFDNDTLDDRNISGGLNATGDKIILHFSQYDADSSFFENIMTLTSNDLSGQTGTWTSSTYYENELSNAVLSPFGSLITLNNNDLIQGWYTREGTDSLQKGPYKIYLSRSYDNGATWDAKSSIVYENDSKYYGEACFEQLGTDTILATVRSNYKEDSLYYVHHIFSFDNGFSWEDPIKSNLNSSYHVLPYTYYDEATETIICSVQRRGFDEYSLFESTKAKIINNPDSCWSFLSVIDTGYRYNGYASSVKFENELFTIYSKQDSVTDCDTKSFLWQLPFTTQTILKEAPIQPDYLFTSTKDIDFILIYNVSGQIVKYFNKPIQFDVKSLPRGINVIKYSINNKLYATTINNL